MLRNVLIFHQAALGDFISTWPMLLGISRVLAQHRVIVITHESKGRLAQRVLGVEYRDAEPWHALFGDASSPIPSSPDQPQPQLDEQRLDLLGQASLVLGIFGQADHVSAIATTAAWTTAVKRLAPQTQVATLRGRPGMNETPLPVSEFLIAQLTTGFAALATASSQMLSRVRTAGLMPRRIRGEHVVLHPGAGSPDKQWPVERFVELATRLKQLNIPVRVVLGEVELERLPRSALATFESLAEVSRPVDYLALLQSIQDARAFVGNDSGPGHLAAIIGVPTISLFGPASNPAVWSPVGPSVRVLHESSLDAISVDRVLGVINESPG